MPHSLLSSLVEGVVSANCAKYRLEGGVEGDADAQLQLKNLKNEIKTG